MKATLYHGKNLDWLRTFDMHTFHACVTDPPYELRARKASGRRGGFMGLRWDATGISFDPEFWGEVYRVLRPGAHVLAFGATRTFHRLFAAIEDAGFELRDCVTWLYGSGYPKSKNLTGEWAGWGSALKPGVELIALARKPLSERNLQANVERWGTGALNIDGCLVDVEDVEGYERNCSGDRGHEENRTRQSAFTMTGGRSRRYASKRLNPGAVQNETGERHGTAAYVGELKPGRWPANVILDEEAAALLDAQSGDLVSGANPSRRSSDRTRNAYGAFAGGECSVRRGVDRGGASRFYYVAKPDVEEREAGLYHLDTRTRHRVNPGGLEHDPKWAPVERRNSHPTVKPVDLMKHLVRLVTPAGGTVLDPFVGSGPTGMAAVAEGFDFVGIDEDEYWVEVSESRIRHVAPLLVDVEVKEGGAC